MIRLLLVACLVLAGCGRPASETLALRRVLAEMADVPDSFAYWTPADRILFEGQKRAVQAEAQAVKLTEVERQAVAEALSFAESSAQRREELFRASVRKQVRREDVDTYVTGLARSRDHLHRCIALLQ